MSERLLTARELGEHLGLSASTVLDRFERGDLPGFRLFGKKGGPVRFRLSEIEAALSNWKVNGPGREEKLRTTPIGDPTRRLVSLSRTPHEGGEEHD